MEKIVTDADCGAANIRFRRARKGFNLKLNPDTKWSRALYRSYINMVGKCRTSMVMGRDDQAGFSTVLIKPPQLVRIL